VGIYGGGGPPGYFQPQQLTVRVGDTVTWTTCANVAHTATSNGGLWDSGNLNPGQSYSFRFTTRGTYPYYCRLHGHTGTIQVY
jgi:plastocyanin